MSVRKAKHPITSNPISRQTHELPGPYQTHESHMKHNLTLLIAFLLAQLATLHAADPLLIENGQARAEIIIAEKPARMTKLAAKELQTYLERA